MAIHLRISGRRPTRPAALVAVERKFLLDQTAEQQAKLAVLERQRDQKDAEHETTEATIGKLEASLPIMQERVEIRKTLYDHTTGSKANYLELLQPFVEEQHELDVQKHHRDEMTAAIATIEEQRVQNDRGISPRPLRRSCLKPSARLKG